MKPKLLLDIDGVLIPYGAVQYGDVNVDRQKWDEEFKVFTYEDS